MWGLEVAPGPPTTTGLPRGATDVDDLECVVLLRQHASGHHQIGPGEIVVGQLLGVSVDQADGPGGRQQRRHRDQAKRCGRISGAENLTGRREIPKRAAGEAGIDHQHVERAWCRRDRTFRRHRRPTHPSQFSDSRQFDAQVHISRRSASRLDRTQIPPLMSLILHMFYSGNRVPCSPITRCAVALSPAPADRRSLAPARSTSCPGCRPDSRRSGRRPWDRSAPCRPLRIFSTSAFHCAFDIAG